MARILIAANSTWNLTNFRGNLISELLRAGHEVITSSPDIQGIEVNGRQVAHRAFQMHRASKSWSEFNSLWQLVAILRQERPDLFLGFTIKPNIYGCIACRLLGIPAIPNVSGLGTAFLRGATFRKTILLLYRAAFARSSKVFFQNPDDKELFVRERVVAEEQCGVLPGSGVDLERFSPTPLPPSLVYLMIARLLGDKGVREYVDAAREVKRQYPQAHFRLLGQVDRENLTAVSLQELDEWKREGIVEYLGSASDVRPVIRQCTAVVLPSYREGLPRTLLEGAAMGRPLIGTNVPGCKELVKEGQTGFLCEARDAASLADAMVRLAQISQDARTSMGRNARRLVAGRYDVAFVTEAYLDAVAAALA